MLRRGKAGRAIKGPLWAGVGRGSTCGGAKHCGDCKRCWGQLGMDRRLSVVGRKWQRGR